MYRSAEQNWIFPFGLVEYTRLADNAGKLIRIISCVSIIVHSVRSTDPIEPDAQVEEYAHLTAWARFAPSDPSYHPAGVSVEGKPAILVRFVVKNVEHALLTCFAQQQLSRPIARAVGFIKEAYLVVVSP